jgi:hypothetical protein
MVRFCIYEMSGNCAANALRSTGAIFGMAGGSMVALAIAMSFEQSISSPHCRLCCCCGSNINLLLILIGILVQVKQKSSHTNDFFYTKFFYTQQVSRPAFQFVPTQTPKHSTWFVTTTINMVLLC